MEKNLKKIVLLFTLVVTAVSIKAPDYSQEDEYPSYADTDDMTSYAEGDSQQDDSYSVPADEEQQNNDTDYAGTFNDAANYTDDQTNYEDSSEEPQSDEVADYSDYYSQDAQMPQSGEASDESMSEPMTDSYENEYVPEDDNFYADETTPMMDDSDDAGVEDYEQPSE